MLGLKLIHVGKRGTAQIKLQHSPENNTTRPLFLLFHYQITVIIVIIIIVFIISLVSQLIL